jgi:FkbM family methyltransferase
MEILDRFKEIISVQDSPFVIEFGACDGYHTNLMCDIMNKVRPNFTYHVFEPIEDLVNQINARIGVFKATNKNIKVFTEAVGSETGTFTFYKSGGGKTENGVIVENYYGSSSIRKPKLVTEAWKEMTFQETTCKSVTFDDYINREGLNGKVIDFIWADIQGAEVDLIMGGKEAFKNVRYFYTEYCDSELYEGEIGLNKILELMPNFEVVEDYKGDVLLKNKNI